MSALNILRDAQGLVMQASREKLEPSPGLTLAEGVTDVPEAFLAPGALFFEVPGMLFDETGRCVWRIEDGKVTPTAPRWPAAPALKRQATAWLRRRLDEVLLRIITLERWQIDPVSLLVLDRSAELNAARALRRAARHLGGCLMKNLVTAFLLALLLLAAPAFAQLRFEDYRARYSNDDDAFAAAVADAKVGPDPRISFYGQITFRRPPPFIDRVHLYGRDIYGSVIYKAYPGGVLFRFEGRDGYSGGGLHNFSIAGAPGNNGSYAILARSRPGYGPHGMVLERLYIGAGFYRAIEIVGYDNPNATNQLGVRQPRINDVTVFGTQAPWSVYLHWTSDARIEALRLYQAGGTYWDLNAVWQNNPGVLSAP